MKNHSERKHSKFSASGSDRWLNCGASVALEEQCPPQKDTPWSAEGTFAHECLEAELTSKPWPEHFDFSSEELKQHIKTVAGRVSLVRARCQGKMFVELRVTNEDIHAEMFGTCDVIILDTKARAIHIIDFKYGKGSIVDPEENTQLIQYALAVAHKVKWNFDRATLHIMQPRSGARWHKEWTVTKDRLQNHFRPLWISGVKRVESGKAKPFEGSWCHWCRARASLCPLKNDRRVTKVLDVFKNNPLESEAFYGKEKSQKESSPKEKSCEESFY